MSRWYDLGDVAVVPVVEIERLLIEPDEFFPDGRGTSNRFFTEPWYDTSARALVYRMQAFVVVTAERTVLVDGCIGSGKRRRRPAFDGLDPLWLSRLAERGVAPADVDDVVFTHLHVDHVGWATRATAEGAWEPVFPGARHVVDPAELDHWTSRAGREAMARTGDYLADSIEPLRRAGILEAVEAPFAVSDHVSVDPARGHTPGHACVRVCGEGGQLSIIGDVMHHPLQLEHPETSTRYCVDPGLAARTRRRILETAEADGTVLVPSHFAGDGAFRVRRSSTGYAMTPADEVIRDADFDLQTWRSGGLAFAP